MILVMSSDYEDLKNELLRNLCVFEEKVNGTTIYKTKINNTEVIFVDSGITKVDFTRNFVNIISKYPICKVIGIGNAASLNQCLKIGGVGICSESLQYDVDFTALGYKLAEIPEVNRSVFYSNEELVRLAKMASEQQRIMYSVGRTISADRFVANNKEAESLKKCFKTEVLDTECGILGGLSYLYCIPSVTIKGISNYGDNCAVKDYNSYRRIANLLSLKIAIAMIEMMN